MTNIRDIPKAGCPGHRTKPKKKPRKPNKRK